MTVLGVIIFVGFALGFVVGVQGAPTLRRRPSRGAKPGRAGFAWGLEGRGQKAWFRMAPPGTSVVYVIRRKGEDRAKVGWTNSLKRRLKTFQAPSDVPIVVVGLAPGGEREEAAIHQALKAAGLWVKPQRGTVMGDEWFELPEAQAPLWMDRIDRALVKARKGQPDSGQLELEGVAA